MRSEKSPTTTLSSKYQVVIPQDVRESLGLKPGVRFSVIPFGDRIELVPIRSLRSLRGFAPGIDTRVTRDADRVWTWSIRRPGSNTSPVGQTLATSPQ